MRRSALILGATLALVRPLHGQEPTGRAPTIAELETSARRDSNDATAQYRLAMGYWEKKKWDDAERTLRQALQVAPSYPEAHLALGVLPMRRGEGYWKERIRREGAEAAKLAFIDGESHYRRAFLLNPLVDLGVLAKFETEKGGIYRMGNQLVFVVRPWWADELNKSKNEFRESRYEKAFERLDKLATHRDFGGEVADAPSEVLWFHGLAAAHLQNFEVAVKDFAILTGRAKNAETDSTRRTPGDPLQTNDYRLILATMLYLNGRFDQAIPTFRRALEFDLGLYAAHVQLARMYEAQDRLDEALTERRLALDVNPDDPDLLMDLAGTLLHAGKTAEAEAPLAEAARLNPRDPRAPYLQGLVAERLRKPDAARSAFQHFLAMAPSRFGPQMDDARQRLAALP